MSKSYNKRSGSAGRIASSIAGSFARGAASRAGDMFLRRISSISTDSHAVSSDALKTLVSNTEYGDGRRANTYTVRLHAAKYLKCDPLMKELFFPLLNMNRNFGFCSTSGMGRLTAPLLADGGVNANQPPAFAKSNGCWRGFATFTIRSDKMDSTDQFKLSAIPIISGTTLTSGSSVNTRSAYRRFNNGPQVSDNASGKAPGYGVDQAQTFVHARATTDDTDFNQDYASISEVGNLGDIETAAVQSVNFQHAIGVSSSSEGTTSTAVRNGTPGGINWDGAGTPRDGDYYYPNLRNTTIRIADGVLEMDVSNGKNSSVILELVLHSQTKQEADFTPQKFFDQVYQSVEYQQNQLRVDGPGASDTNTAAPGGWQAFYDPEYPFLSIKSAHAKKANSMYREVHRSIHTLAPGQSKTLKVLLGSHYYGLGSKTLDDDGSSSTTRLRPRWTAFPAGNLLVSLAHSGVSQLTMPTIDNTTQFNNLPDTYSIDTGSGNVNHTVTGAGFWLGKQRAPSEIVVKGSYKEKFYPGYVISDQRNNYDDYAMMPPIASGGGNTLLLGAGLPVQETFGVVQVDKKAVGAKVATSVRDEL